MPSNVIQAITCGNVTLYLKHELHETGRLTSCLKQRCVSYSWRPSDLWPVTQVGTVAGFCIPVEKACSVHKHEESTVKNTSVKFSRNMDGNVGKRSGAFELGSETAANK